MPSDLEADGPSAVDTDSDKISSLSARGSGITSLSWKDAEKALARYAKQGYDCDPFDESHQRAYLQLRATCGRVDGKTFLQFLNSKKRRATSYA